MSTPRRITHRFHGGNVVDSTAAFRLDIASVVSSTVREVSLEAHSWVIFGEKYGTSLSIKIYARAMTFVFANSLVYESRLDENVARNVVSLFDREEPFFCLKTKFFSSSEWWIEYGNRAIVPARSTGLKPTGLMQGRVRVPLVEDRAYFGHG